VARHHRAAPFLVVRAPATDALGWLALLDADEEIVRAQRGSGHESQPNRQRGLGVLPLASLLLCGGRWGLRRVELARGRLQADALAIALGRLRNLHGNRAPAVVIIPE
jgi:hypothetical protein